MQLISVAGGPKILMPTHLAGESSGVLKQTAGSQYSEACAEECACCPTDKPAATSTPPEESTLSENKPLSRLQKTLLFPIKIYQKLTEPVYHWLSQATGIKSFCLHCQAGKLSCSEYTTGAIREFGIFRGIWDGFKRILSCNPINAYLHYVKHKPLRDPEALSPETTAAVKRPRLNLAA
jgi:putative component of membrane protein insertase Oxa1/YidC/SpoIIIJ protein YidD